MLAENPAAADGLVKDTTTAAFRQDVIQESSKQPVLVDFWAPWCGPCKQLTPVIEKAVKAAGGKVKLVKMNIDEHPQIAGPARHPVDPGGHRLHQRPAGRRLHGRAAREPGQGLHRPPRRPGRPEPGRGPPGARPMRAAAEGDAGGAAELYAAVLAQDPENVAAIAALAKLHLDLDDLEGAKRFLAMAPTAKENDPAIAGARAAIELAEQAASLGDTGELERRLAANPLDHQARFDLALALNARGRREEAIDAAARHRPPRAHLERRGGAQAARPVLRGLGADRRHDGARAAAAVVDAVRLTSPARRGHGHERRLSGAAGPADVIPVFPLPGALLLPRGQMPLNIFEPRYLAMVDEALRTNRLIGMIQPDPEGGGTALVPKLYAVGCAGRITQFAETGDGRYLITLTGIARFRVEEEAPTTLPFRLCRVTFLPFAADFVARAGEDEVDRAAVLTALRAFVEANDLKLDWKGVEQAPNEALVNALSMMSPFGPTEKQALLEAPDLKTRAEMLVAITEIELARAHGGDGSEPTLQ